MPRSVAIVMSWAVYAVVGLAAVHKAAQTPNVDTGTFMAVLIVGTIGLLVIHSWAVDRDRRG